MCVFLYIYIYIYKGGNPTVSTLTVGDIPTVFNFMASNPNFRRPT